MGDTPDVLPPLDLRWAKPKPPPPPVLSKLRDYTRLNVAPVPTTTVLSARRSGGTEAPVRPAEEGPHSARQPLDRSRSADARRPPMPGKSPAASPRLDKAPKVVDCEGFLSVLVENGASCLEPSVLARLESEAATSRRLVELVRLLRTIAAQQQDAADAHIGEPETEEALEMARMAAQVVYLEKKLLRLREKVKRRAKEKEAAGYSLAPPAEVDVGTASVDDLAREAAELAALQNLQQQHQLQLLLQEPITPPTKVKPPGKERRPKPGGQDKDKDKDKEKDKGEKTSGVSPEEKEATDALKKQFVALQAQLRDLDAERAAAEASAQKAGALAEEVEQRLQDMVRAREAERARLEAEREQLEKTVEQQATKLEEVESLCPRESTTKPEDLIRRIEVCQAKVVTLNKAIAKEQRRVQKALDIPRVPGSEPVVLPETPEPEEPEEPEVVASSENGESGEDDQGDQELPGEDYAEGDHENDVGDIDQDTGEPKPDSEVAGEAEVHPEDEHDSSIPAADDAALAAPEPHEDPASASRPPSGSEILGQDLLERTASPRFSRASNDVEEIGSPGPGSSRPPSCNENDILRATAIASKEEKNLVAMLQKHKDDAEASLQKLQEKLEEARAAHDREELAKRKNLAAETQRVAQLLAERNTASQANPSIEEGPAGESAKVSEVRQRLEQIAAELAQERKQMEADAAKADQLLADRLKQLQDEVESTKHRQGRKGEDLRSRFILSLRPEAYSRRELMHYLSLTASVPSTGFSVLRESVVEDDTPSWALAEVPGQKLKVEEQDANAFVRPLPAPKGSPPLLQPNSSREKLDGGQSVTASPSNPSPEEEVAPSEGALVRVMFEVIGGPEVGSSTAYRLLKEVESGGSLLEDMALVGCCAHRGCSTFPQDAGWVQSEAAFFARRPCRISGRDIVLSGYGMSTSSSRLVKLVAVDPTGGEDYMLCLTSDDLTSLLKDPYVTGIELLLQLLPTLRFIDSSDGHPAFVAVDAVAAPATVLNDGPPPRNPPPMSAYDVQASAPMGEPNVLMVDENVQKKSEPRPTISKMDPKDAIAWIETGTSSSSSLASVAEAPSTGTDFEDVLFFEDHCFLLHVRIHDATGEVQVKLQEAGNCQFIDILLPGRSDPKQLRAFVQSHDFGQSSIFVAVEDLALPPAVVVRVSRGEVASQHHGNDPTQQVYWFSTSDDNDGGLGHVRVTEGEGEAPSAVVSALLSKHRSRLLDCAAAEPYAGLGARPMLALAGHPGYGHEAGKAGAAMSDPNGPRHHLQDAQAALVASQLLDAAKLQTDRPLLKMGFRMPLPNDFSTLCVVSVWENFEPYQHFVISAHEVGTCNVWDLLISSLDIFKALEMRLGPQMDLYQHQAFAAELVKSCELVENNEGNLELVVGSNAESGWLSGGGVGAAPPPLATARAESCKLQLLSQDAARAMLQEEGRYCLLQSPRRFPSRLQDAAPLVVSILDEPEAPEAPFHISNLVVIVEEDPESASTLCFSMRLNDNSLKAAFGEEELLEPENRSALLERILLSLDLETLGTGGGERLVLQSQPVISSVGLLRSDGAGTLRPVDLEAATAAGTILALADATNRSQGSAGSTRLPSHALPALPAVAEEDPPQELIYLPEGHVGCFAVESPDVIDGRVLGQKEAKVGNLEIEMVLKADSGGHSHVLIVRCLSSDEQALAVQIPAEGEPTRAYLEHRKLAQTNVIVSVVHQAVPHEVRAIVFDPITQEEAQLIVASESIMPLVERSTRERLSDASELMAQLGALHQSGEFRLASQGREILPSDSKRRALQSHVPIIRTKFSPSEAEITGSADTRDLLYSCCRYVLGREAITKARKEDSVLQDVPQLRISLSKKCHCQDFTLTIEQIAEDVTASLPPHFLHIRDKLSGQPLGLFAEVCIIGDLRILVVCLDDGAPRSFRLALLEPVSGWSFQIIVVDEASPSTKRLGGTSRDERVALPELGPSLPRRELLRLFQRRFGARQGLSSTPAAPLVLAAHVEDVTEEAKHQILLSRTSRVVDGTDLAVLLNVLAEVDEEGPLGVRVVLSQVNSSKESSFVVIGEALDTVLAGCGLPQSQGFHGSGSLSILDGPKEEVSRMILKCLEVSPTLQMGFAPENLSSSTGFQAPRLALHDFTKRPETGEVELDCSEDRLLASAKRLLADDVDHDDENAFEGAIKTKAGAELEKGGAEENAEGDDFLQPRKLHIEVFDGSDCREALFHSTNLRIRVSVKPSGPSATRDLHEADLEDWLEKAGAGHLLNASREADLIDLLLEHAMLSDPYYSSTKRPVVLLRDIRKEASSQSRFFAAGLLESAAQPLLPVR